MTKVKREESARAMVESTVNQQNHLQVLKAKRFWQM